MSKFLLIPFLLLFFLSCLRWERGTDWQAYTEIFNGIDNTFYLLYYEPGFYYLNYFVRLFTENFTVMLVVQALLIFPIHYYVMKRYSELPMLSTLIWFGFFIGAVFFVRFHVALSFTLLSYVYVINRKFWKFFACVLIASMFHRTAILFIPAYFFYNKIWSRKVFLILIVSSFFLSSIFKVALEFLSNISLGTFSEKAIAYLAPAEDESHGLKKSGFEVMLIGVSYRLILMGLILWYYYRYYIQNPRFRGFFNIYIVGMCLFIIVTPISIPMARMSIYYEYVQLLIVPLMVGRFKLSSNRNIVLLIIGLFYLFRLVSNVNAYEDLYIPYKSIFNKELPVEIR